MAELSQILVGRTLSGAYLLEKWLGQGGHGTIYLARHVRTRGLLAVKLLRRDIVSDPQLIARFVAEARIIAELRHPHIVQVIDCDQDEHEGPFMVMEFLEGETLQERLQRVGQLDYPGACELAAQVGSALHAVHEQRIIHRDIKPANVFITKRRLISKAEDFYKVVDFGISKLRLDGTQTVTNQMVGTPHYMAPEAALQKSEELDGRVDQFSLAVVLYRVLTGRLPFEGEEPIGVLHRVVYEEPESLALLSPDLPEHALTAIERAMAKRKEDRYATIDEFVQTFCGVVTPTWHVTYPGLADPSSAEESRAAAELLTDLDEEVAADATTVHPSAAVSHAKEGGATPVRTAETPYSLAKGMQHPPLPEKPKFKYGAWAVVTFLGVALGLLASWSLRGHRGVAPPAPHLALVPEPRALSAPATHSPQVAPATAGPSAGLDLGLAIPASPPMVASVTPGSGPSVMKPIIAAPQTPKPGSQKLAHSGLHQKTREGLLGVAETVECCLLKAAYVHNMPIELQPAAKQYLDSHRIQLCGTQPVRVIQSTYDQDLVWSGKLDERTQEKPLRAFLNYLYIALYSKQPRNYRLSATISMQCPATAERPHASP